MPGTIVGFTSGGQLLFSGAPFSGRASPVGGVQLIAHPANSGVVYVGLSGGLTVLSGNFPLSGGGMLDGMPLSPGAAYFVPKVALLSGGPLNVYLGSDVACSGQARVHFEIF